MKNQWHRYESQIRLAGSLIILVVMVQNALLTWLFHQAKDEARRQMESRLFLVAAEARSLWNTKPAPRPDSLIIRWGRLNLSGGSLNIGIIGRNGQWAVATNTASFTAGTAPLAGLDGTSYRKLDEAGWAVSGIYQRQRRALVRCYLKAGLNGSILAVEAPADFLNALDSVARFELWSSALLLLAVIGLSLWYLKSVLAPFRHMAAVTRETLGENAMGIAPDVALVMEVYQKTLDDLRSKGRGLQELYDQTKSQAERSEALNRQILDNIDKGVITADEQGQALSCNHAAERILGRAGIASIQSWLDDEGILPRLSRQAVFVWEQPGPGSGTQVIQIESGPLRDAGSAGPGRILILSDITGWRALEEQAALSDRTRWLSQAARLLYQKVSTLLDELRGDCRQPGWPGGDFRTHLDEIERAVGDFGGNLEYFPNAAQPSFSAAIVFRSAAMRQVLDLVSRVAPSDSTVLITGESGTGKELLAREIHRLSRRSNGPFVSLNCGALPESLLESELFGYVKGAFTGALRDKPGLLKAAEGGTFFLDEVGDLSPALQVKLLRVIQERETVAVGATKPVAVDIRLLAASNQDLDVLVKAGRFRHDLFFRLNVFPIVIPPLRQRPDDIAILTEAILKKLALKTGKEIRVVSDNARELLARHDWPGNVRELENVLERAALLAPGTVLEAEHLGMQARDVPSRHLASDGLLAIAARAAAAAETEVIRATLKEVDGNKSEAARRLKISYRVMLKKIKDYNLES